MTSRSNMSDTIFMKAEAIFYALRKTKEGIIVSFVLHPNDLSDGLTRSPIGTRVMLAVAELTDDATQETEEESHAQEN
jgi:hypothetical protein